MSQKSLLGSALLIIAVTVTSGCTTGSSTLLVKTPPALKQPPVNPVPPALVGRSWNPTPPGLKNDGFDYYGISHASRAAQQRP